MRIKCPHCNGKGFSEINSAINMTCGWCMGQGELDLEIVPKEPQTEKEYLQTCTTEQLADVLAKQKCDGCNDEPYDEDYGVCKYCMMKKKEQIREWLKQPHREE